MGNWLMGDDGIGVRVVEQLASRERKLADASVDRNDPGIEYLDGGVGGLRLINWIEQAPRLLFVDAARMGLPPGRCRLFRLDDLTDEPAAPGPEGLPGSTGPLSLHQTGLLDVMRLTRQFYRCPPTWLLAIQVERVEQGEGFSPPVQAALPRLVEVVRRLASRLVTRET